METLVNEAIAALLGAALGAAVPAINAFLEQRRIKRYLPIASRVLAALDKAIAEVPGYEESKFNEAVDLAISISADGQLSREEALEIKKIVIDKFDPAKIFSPKALDLRAERAYSSISELLRFNRG